MAVAGSAEQPKEVRIEWHMLLAYLRQDADFRLYKSRVFLRRQSGELMEVFDNDDHAANMGSPSTDNQAARQQLEAHAEEYLEIPIPNHAMRHQWLREFLKDLGRESEYFGSIGGWLEEWADQSDVDAWHEFERERVIAHAVDVAAKSGITLKVI